MSLLTKGVGQLIIDVVALTAVDPDCNSATAATITWTDLGETYQLERSTDATNWTVKYTGTSFAYSDISLSNVDQVYYYRVKVVGDDKYSNIGYFQIYQQNKYLRDLGCVAYNVAPYLRRYAYRQNCGERYSDVVDETNCKAKPEPISCEKRWDTYLKVPGPSGSTSSHTLTISVAGCDPSGSGTVGGVTLSPSGGLSPATAQSVTSATYGGGVATIQISITIVGNYNGLMGWMRCGFSTLVPS